MTGVKTIFIDGEAGTTGLQIRDRLTAVEGVRLRHIADDLRKDPDARKALMAEVDLTVLCLPDDAAREAVALAASLGDDAPKILDASTAHRTQDDWTYGFSELCDDGSQKQRIREARRVANPGCYATGAIALLRPLTKAGMAAPSHPFTINAVSGYTGGGKALIAEFDSGQADAFYLYGLTLAHKHLPEIIAHSSLTQPPLFVPSVGNFPQGMLVSVPLQLASLVSAETRAADIRKVFHDYYGPGGNSQVVVHEGEPAKLSADTAAGDDAMHIYIFAHEAQRQVLLVAQLDNLGKGAAGAAVQNIRLMLGLD